MGIKAHSHIAFADETNHTADSGRYGAIALLSMPFEITENLHKKLSEYQQEKKIKEFKWQKIKDSKQRKMATIFINTIIEEACRENLRIDVLSWDYHDRRHKIKVEMRLPIFIVCIIIF